MECPLSISYIDETGTLLRERPLTELKHLDMYPFPSVRDAVAYKGQPHLPGFYWMARQNELVLYESRLEMCVLMQLDFNPDVACVCAQPFILHYGAGYLHVPDYFIWFEQGDSQVVDVKPLKYVSKECNQRAFSAAEKACEQIGWKYSVQSEPHETFLANLKWLSGYKRQPADFKNYAEQLIELCTSGPKPLGSLVAACDASSAWAVRPVLFHLLWRRLLNIDLYSPMTNDTLVNLATIGGTNHGF